MSPCWSRVKSTMPVKSFEPRPPSLIGLVQRWCQMCSSTRNKADILEPGRVSGHVLQKRPDGAPYRAPRGHQLTCQACHAGVLTAQLVDDPPTGPRR